MRDKKTIEEDLNENLKKCGAEVGQEHILLVIMELSMDIRELLKEQKSKVK